MSLLRSLPVQASIPHPNPTAPHPQAGARHRSARVLRTPAPKAPGCAGSTRPCSAAAQRWQRRLRAVSSALAVWCGSGDADISGYLRASSPDGRAVGATFCGSQGRAPRSMNCAPSARVTPAPAGLSCHLPPLVPVTPSLRSVVSGTALKARQMTRPPDRPAMTTSPGANHVHNTPQHPPHHTARRLANVPLSPLSQRWRERRRDWLYSRKSRQRFVMRHSPQGVGLFPVQIID